MDVKDIAAVRDIAVLDQMYPYVQSTVNEMERALENRIMTELAEGTLTPEKALQAWIEKVSYRKILSRFNTRLRVGQDIAQKNPGILDKGLGSPK